VTTFDTTYIWQKTINFFVASKDFLFGDIWTFLKINHTKLRIFQEYIVYSTNLQVNSKLSQSRPKRQLPAYFDKDAKTHL
jgi:hypothetical protein